MKKLAFFSAVGVVFFWGAAVAQTGDTQGVQVQLMAKSSYDRVAVLNYLQNQEYEEAVSYLAPIVKADSGNSGLLGYAGYAYYMTEDNGSAAACYRRLLGIDSNNIPALHYLLLMSANERPADAMEYASRLLRLQRDRAPWWRAMGELFSRVNQKDSALVYFGEAYSRAPGDVRTIAGLADLLLERKDFGRVDSILDFAQGRDSLNPTLNKLAVRAAYLSQHFARAIAPGERLVRSDEVAFQGLTQLALSYYNLKQYPDCIRVCEHMLDLGLVEQSIYYYDSRAWSKLKEYRRSDSLLGLAVKMAVLPQAEWYYDDLAANHEALREFRQAVANYDTAYYLFKDPTVLYACGRICETEIHDLSRARRYYLRYLEVARPRTAEEKQAWAWVRKRWGKKGG